MILTVLLIFSYQFFFSSYKIYLKLTIIHIKFKNIICWRESCHGIFRRMGCSNYNFLKIFITTHKYFFLVEISNLCPHKSYQDINVNIGSLGTILQCRQESYLSLALTTKCSFQSTYMYMFYTGYWYLFYLMVFNSCNIFYFLQCLQNRCAILFNGI